MLAEENPEARNARLVLAETIGKIIKTGMKLLGIDVPERM
jgi:arginyl-tRNA synthetase